MTMTKFTEIPDIKFALSEDGDLIDIEQGQLDPVYIQLHKIHIKYLAEVMKIVSDEVKTSSMLVDYLEQINEQATHLFDFLNSIPNSHPRDIEPECLVRARKLMIITNKVLSYWGNN